MKKIKLSELKNTYTYSKHDDKVIVWDNGTYLADRKIRYDNERGFIMLSRQRYYLNGNNCHLVRE